MAEDWAFGPRVEECSVGNGSGLSSRNGGDGAHALHRAARRLARRRARDPALRPGGCGRRRVVRRGTWGDRCAGRPFRVGQVDVAPPHSGARAARRRTDHDRRPRGGDDRRRRPAGEARRRHDVPGLRAVPASHRDKERDVRAPLDARGRGARGRGPGSGAGRACGARRGLSAHAVGRRAAARGAGAGARAAAGHPAHGRALLQPRPPDADPHPRGHLRRAPRGRRPPPSSSPTTRTMPCGWPTAS